MQYEDFAFYFCMFFTDTLCMHSDGVCEFSKILTRTSSTIYVGILAALRLFSSLEAFYDTQKYVEQMI
jgi:hypothetical protein